MSKVYLEESTRNSVLVGVILQENIAFNDGISVFRVRSDKEFLELNSPLKYIDDPPGTTPYVELIKGLESDLNDFLSLRALIKIKAVETNNEVRYKSITILPGNENMLLALRQKQPAADPPECTSPIYPRYGFTDWESFIHKGTMEEALEKALEGIIND